jgi:hypothetical protein
MAGDMAGVMAGATAEDATWVRSRLRVLTYLLIVVGVITVCALGLAALGINRSNHLAAVTKRAAESTEEQSRSNAKVLGALKDLATSAEAAAKDAKSSSDQSAAAAKASQATSEFLSKCFSKDGECAKAAAETLRAFGFKLDVAVNQIDRNTKTTEFIVQRIEDTTGGQQQFRAVPVPSSSPCAPAIGVGNLGVLSGVACVKP